MSYTLEQTREIDGATLLDDSGRYYAKHSKGHRVYGYNTAWGCGYVCYTCGHLCECEGEGE
jgi:hypothetical protein